MAEVIEEFRKEVNCMAEQESVRGEGSEMRGRVETLLKPHSQVHTVVNGSIS